MENVGIYVLKTSKHFYIGLSSNLKTRKNQHFLQLKKNIHKNAKLQNIYNKGYKIEFEIIQECEIDDLNRLEVLWINLYQTLHPELEILNLKSGGNRPTYTYESREKISISKCKNDYNFEQTYAVYNLDNDELLYVDNALGVSKFLKVDLYQLFNMNTTYSENLKCKIYVIECFEDIIFELK